jgi:hypothetical protein
MLSASQRSGEPKIRHEFLYNIHFAIRHLSLVRQR